MRKRLLLVGLALSALLAGLVVPAALSNPGSVGSASGFEDDDGNLAVDSAFDWNGFNPTTWTGTAPNRTSSTTASGWAFTGLEDAQATTSDSGLAGGTKQDNECPSVITAKAANKDDLKRVYFANKTVDGNVYLDLAWARIPQNTTAPSAHVAFEFDQGTTSCGAGSDELVHRSTANGGDMLIVYDFEGGATDTPHIKLERWVGTGACEVSSHSPPCWGPAKDLTDLGFAEAKVNTTATVLDTIAPSNENLGLNEFGEAGIDLTAAGVFPKDVCVGFGKGYAVSRTSGNSATAQMKDLVGPGDVNIANCGAIKITKTSSKDDSPLAGAEFDIRKAADNSLVAHVTTGPDGTACEGDLPLGDYTVTETAAPSGYQADDTSAHTVTVSAIGTCGSGNEATISFSDTPLSEIQVKFTSLAGPGVTKASIVCEKAGSAVSPVSENGSADPAFDDTDETFTDLAPGTYTCTVVVDP